MIISYCKNCNKEIKCFPSRPRTFCNKKCENEYKKGRVIGKYSKYQINAMIKGKKDAYLSRVLQKEKDGIYNLNRIKFILSIVPLNNTRQLAKLLGFKENESKAPIRELKYLLEYYKLDNLFTNIKYPECYTSSTPEQLLWYNDILSKVNNYYEFNSLFLENYKKYNARKSLVKYSNLIIYVQYKNIKTHALKSNLEKNLSKCGTTCEIKVRNLLNNLNCKYVEQKHIIYEKYRISYEKKDGEHFYKPDFIVDDRIIIEVNGDYWHSYGLKEEDMNEIQLNRKNMDIKKYLFYNKMNYRFIIIWEHDLANIENVKQKILGEINNEGNYKRIIYK